MYKKVIAIAIDGGGGLGGEVYLLMCDGGPGVGVFCADLIVSLSLHRTATLENGKYDMNIS